MVVHTPQFTDAQESAKLHPKTFYAPNAQELDAIRVGYNVKVCTNNERFWALVTKVEGNAIWATVNNDLVNDHGFGYEDTIQFDKRHVMDILPC